MRGRPRPEAKKKGGKDETKAKSQKQKNRNGANKSVKSPGPIYELRAVKMGIYESPVGDNVHMRLYSTARYKRKSMKR